MYKHSSGKRNDHPFVLYGLHLVMECNRNYREKREPLDSSSLDKRNRKATLRKTSNNCNESTTDSQECLYMF